MKLLKNKNGKKIRSETPPNNIAMPMVSEFEKRKEGLLFI
jgi:hypothetical protein